MRLSHLRTAGWPGRSWLEQREAAGARWHSTRVLAPLTEPDPPSIVHLMDRLPAGTVTFLFTDIEGSTALWENHPDVMGRAVAVHNSIIRHSIEEHNGRVFATLGDGFAAAFESPVDAARAALSAQDELAETSWPEGISLAVRMGLHTGIAEARGGDYLGPPVNQAARTMGVAAGSQIAVSETTHDLLRHLIGGWGELSPLWSGRPKGIERRTVVYLLSRPGSRPPGRYRRIWPAVVGASVVLASLGVVLGGGGRTGESADPSTTGATGPAPTRSASTTAAAVPVLAGWEIRGFGAPIGAMVATTDGMLVAASPRGGISLIEADGTVRDFEIPGRVLTAPVPIGDVIAVATRGGLLAGYDPETGAESARCVFGGLEVTTPPSILGDSLVVATGDQGQVRRLRLDSDGCELLAVNTSATLGRVEAMVALDDQVIAVDRLGRVYLFDADDLRPRGGSAEIGRIPEPAAGTVTIAGAVIRVAGAAGTEERVLAYTTDADRFLFAIDVTERSVVNTGIRVDGDVTFAADGDLIAVVIDASIRRRLQRLDAESLVPLDASESELGDVIVGPVRGDTLLYVSDGPRVVAFDAETLDHVWDLALTVEPVSLAEYAGLLVVATGEGDLLALTPSSP